MALDPHIETHLANALSSGDVAAHLVRAIDEALASGGVSTVAGRRGDVTLTTADVAGLGSMALRNAADFESRLAALESRLAALEGR